MNILTVRNLTKKYGSYTAVDGISMDLKEGEILGVLGPNGAGKTTTIQMLLGILTPTNGEISYYGKNFHEHREELLEKINFSSTYTNLAWNLTVKENFSYLSFLYTITDRKKRLNDIVSLFKLEDIYNLRISALSAGQLTRVNLAKAFINFPSILLLDEPTASLDPDIAKYIREFLLKERERFNVSIILTSHNMAEVEEVCDRVIFLDAGKIIADNTPDKLAQSIEICHVELIISDGLRRVVVFCRKNKHPYRLDARNIVVDIKEKAIAEFLQQVTGLGVSYDQISIDKPTLEDYFLQVASKSKRSKRI